MRTLILICIVVTLLAQHPEPTQNCSHKPKANQVECKCNMKCNEDGQLIEDTKCSSFCWSKHCLCPRNGCDVHE